ncbi:MAG TPA: cytochrome c biogenesis protein CcdA [Blastocatellia bacterium]|nr:cytochrome c biogenesis protein CcdA [Blastocatellia bacterium]
MVRSGQFRFHVIAALMLVCGLAISAMAQLASPINLSAKLDPNPVKAGQTAKVTVTAKIDSGWHLYSLTQPAGGPRPTKISIDETGPFKANGKPTQPKPKVAADPNFSIPGQPPFMTETFDGEAAFSLPIKVAEGAPVGNQKLTVKFYFQVCNDHECLPPRTKPLDVDVAIVAANAKLTPSPSPEASPTTSASPASSPEATASPTPDSAVIPATGSTTTPNPPSANDEDQAQALKNRGLFGFIWFAVLQGLLALLTPCVFPMIPITVSFFTKREKRTSAQAVGQASFFSLGIILTYTVLGLALAVIAGPTGLTKFAANPWMNLFLTLLFVVFALNLFGMFEIQVPSGLVNKLNASADSGTGSQTFATILMGITFTLTSFTCTTAFVGTVLIYATQGDWFWAVIGMVAFATAFALPFFLFALFPQWLQSLPKSGGWLNSVKVVMGFLELGAAFKFLSNVDLVWGWQTISRPLVLSAWIAIALATALYLLGKIQLPHDSPVERLGVFRMLMATFFLGLAFYFLTGLLGGSLGEFDAWLPPSSAKDFALNRSGSNAAEAKWHESYDAVLQKAKAENRPAFLNFTGVTCTNCRWMEKNMFPDPAVKQELEKFVLAELYTDREDTPEHQKIDEENGKLQAEKFGTVALPLYAVIDPSGNILAKFPGLTRDKQEFVQFLQRGASRFQPMTAQK